MDDEKVQRDGDQRHLARGWLLLLVLLQNPLLYSYVGFVLHRGGCHGHFRVDQNPALAGDLSPTPHRPGYGPRSGHIVQDINRLREVYTSCSHLLHSSHTL